MVFVQKKKIVKIYIFFCIQLSFCRRAVSKCILVFPWNIMENYSCIYLDISQLRRLLSIKSWLRALDFSKYYTSVYLRNDILEIFNTNNIKDCFSSALVRLRKTLEARLNWDYPWLQKFFWGTTLRFFEQSFYNVLTAMLRSSWLHLSTNTDRRPANQMSIYPGVSH